MQRNSRFCFKVRDVPGLSSHPAIRQSVPLFAATRSPVALLSFFAQGGDGTRFCLEPIHLIRQTHRPLSHRVLRLSQGTHNVDSSSLAREPLHSGILLGRVSVAFNLSLDRSAEPLTSSLINTLCAFSSPIVNFPCVCLFSLAKASSFLMGSDCMTLMPNLTLPLVYSCPGCKQVSEAGCLQHRSP